MSQAEVGLTDLVLGFHILTVVVELKLGHAVAHARVDGRSLGERVAITKGGTVVGKVGIVLIGSVGAVLELGVDEVKTGREIAAEDRRETAL